MQLLYVGTFMFEEKEGGTWSLPSSADAFFAKYLDVFDSVRVLGEGVKSYLDKSAFVPIQHPRIHVRILPANTHPCDFINDRALKRTLEEEIRKAEAILIVPTSRRGMMAIRLAEKSGKPYMIEMLADLHSALKQKPSLLKRLYAPVIYRQIKRAITTCKYGLYVSKTYLQSKYPISGEMCGCSDVVLEKADTSVLARRLERIEAMKEGAVVQVALIGFYQDTRKGVDVAIRALGRLPEHFHLSVLGNGTEEDRQKLYGYAQAHGVNSSRLHFPQPLPSTRAVLRWLDDIDLFVLPARSEGLPRALAEAISRGLPCFATNICGIPELLPSEYLIEPNDDKKLAELLLSHGKDKELMKRAARVNFEHAEEYNADKLRERRNAFLCRFRTYCLQHHDRKGVA